MFDELLNGLSGFNEAVVSFLKSELDRLIEQVITCERPEVSESHKIRSHSRDMISSASHPPKPHFRDDAVFQ
jgi:hypothetical protein